MPSSSQKSPHSLLGKAKYDTLPVESLEYDDSNPRLGGQLHGRSPEDLQRFLEGPPNFALDLVESMVENGFIAYEPLVVRKKNQHFVVIEGNRRLAAVKHVISNPEKYGKDAAKRLERIPVLIFHESEDESHLHDIQTYLGVKHLFGFREWPPRSKAIFLDKRIRSAEDITIVTRELSIPKREIARYLVPYRLQKAAKDIFRSIDTEDFWALAESFGRSNIKAYIELDVDRRLYRIRSFNKKKLDYLAEFLYGRDGMRKAGRRSAKGSRRITDTRQLSTLSKVLASPIASRKLEKGASLEEALIYVEPKEQSLKTLMSQLDRLFKKILLLAPTGEAAKRIKRQLRGFQRNLKSGNADG